MSSCTSCDCIEITVINNTTSNVKATLKLTNRDEEKDTKNLTPSAVEKFQHCHAEGDSASIVVNDDEVFVNFILSSQCEPPNFPQVAISTNTVGANLNYEVRTTSSGPAIDPTSCAQAIVTILQNGTGGGGGDDDDGGGGGGDVNINTSSSGLSGGEIAGITIGVIVGVVLLVVLPIVLVNKHKKAAASSV